MSLTSRKMMLVPLPLALQHFLKFTSDHIPTLTLLAFVVIQFVLNILHYIPAKYWQNWVDRTRYVLKTLLDRDYRLERYQIDLLRQRLAESDRRNATTVQELDGSQGTVRSLRERIVKQSTECDAHKGLYESEAARLSRQLEAQAKLLAETEALLEALRAGDTTRLSRLGSEDKKAYADRIKSLEEHVTTLTKERREVADEVQKLQGARQTVQDQCDKNLHANIQLQTEKEDLVKQLEAMKVMERRLTESRNEALTRLNQTLQYSTATNSAFDEQRNELLRQMDDAVAAKNEAERRLQEKEQQLTTVDSGSKESSESYAQLQEKIKALEDYHNTTSQQATQALTDQNQAVSKAESKVAELEAALAEKLKANEELVQHISTKDEEINRLSEIIEHGDLRPHKLKKPRNSIPLTPPATLSSHNRSNSISSRLGFDRERQRTLSTGSYKAHHRSNSASPSVSPAHRAQTALPPAQPYDVSAPGTVSESVAAGEDTTGAADTSMASSTGSVGPAPPSLGKSSRRKHTGTRQRLSSILGIHIGDKDKDKTEKEKEKEKDKGKDHGMVILPHV